MHDVVHGCLAGPSGCERFAREQAAALADTDAIDANAITSSAVFVLISTVAASLSLLKSHVVMADQEIGCAKFLRMLASASDG